MSNKATKKIPLKIPKAIDEHELEEKSDTPPGTTKMEYDDETDDDTGGTRELRSKRRQDSPRAQIDEEKSIDATQSSSEEPEDYGEPEDSAHGDCSEDG